MQLLSIMLCPLLFFGAHKGVLHCPEYYDFQTFWRISSGIPGRTLTKIQDYSIISESNVIKCIFISDQYMKKLTWKKHPTFHNFEPYSSVANSKITIIFRIFYVRDEIY